MWWTSDAFLPRSEELRQLTSLGSEASHDKPTRLLLAGLHQVSEGKSRQGRSNVIPALLILVVYIFVLWLVFVQLKIAQFSIAWGVISALVGVHLLLIFLIEIGRASCRERV